MTLRAPIAIPVEIRIALTKLGSAQRSRRGKSKEPFQGSCPIDARRSFRLAAAVGEDGMRLETAVPFEAGRVVEARFALPDGPFLVLPARLDGRDGDPADALTFLEPPADARRALHGYVVDRLELPS